MKTPTKAVLAALAAVLLAGTLAARAAPSSCSVASAPGSIDTRDAAIGGCGAAIVVETRPGDTKATASGVLDTATDFAFVLVIK